MNPEVLITGANGFLGRHLLRTLVQEGAKPLALMRPAASCRSEVEEHARVIEGSPLEPSGWIEQARGATTIVHSAAIVRHTREAPEEMQRFNVESSQQAVRAAKALGARLVLVSSSGTVGCFRKASVVADEDAPYAEELAGRWPYYASKIRAEQAATRLARELGVSLHIVRPPVLLGPGDVGGRSAKHVTRVLHGQVPFVPSGGIDFCDVRDVARSVARLAVRGGARRIYHLPGASTSLAEFFGWVAEVAGVRFSRPEVRRPVVEGVAFLGRHVPALKRAGLPDSVVLEMSTCHWGLSTLWSHQELGHRARSPRQTLADTVGWVRQNASPVAASR